jgi:ESX secretion system ATPase EccB
VLTRRDQVQAYRFAQARVQAALLSGQPDRADVPMRRQRFAWFIGLMVAVLVVCGAGVWGLLRPGTRSSGWQARNTLVIEEGTGTRFVYDPGDGKLHPVLNYASARLILNSATVTVSQFSQASLAAAPRGATRGVAGLPDEFPGPGGLLSGPWLACSGSAPQSVPWTTLTVGTAPAGQRLDTAHAVLVQTPDGRESLIWNDHRLEVTQASALTAWGLGSATPVQVTASWLDTVAPGHDIAAPAVPQLGQATTYLVGGEAVRSGQIQKVDAAPGVDAQYYLTLPDGLESVPNSVALLLLGDRALSAAYDGKSPEAITRPSADIAGAKMVAPLTIADFPSTVPHVIASTVAAAGSTDGTAVVCGSYTDTTGRTVVSAVYVGGQGTGAGRLPGVTAPQPSAQSSVTEQPVTAANVLMPPGHAAVIRPLPHDGVASSALFLLTDAGVKFPVPSTDVLNVLGLGGVTPVPVPSGIVDVVPTGRTLDPATANVDVPATGGTPGTGG